MLEECICSSQIAKRKKQTAQKPWEMGAFFNVNINHLTIPSSGIILLKKLLTAYFNSLDLLTTSQEKTGRK